VIPLPARAGDNQGLQYLFDFLSLFVYSHVRYSDDFKYLLYLLLDIGWLCSLAESINLRLPGLVLLPMLCLTEPTELVLLRSLPAGDVDVLPLCWLPMIPVGGALEASLFSSTERS